MTSVSNGGTTTLGLYDTQSQLAQKADITYVDNKVDPLVGGHKGFATLALAQAAQSGLAANTVVEVLSDTTEANNGYYLWNGTTLIKSAYDPLTQAKSYADTAASKAKLPVYSAIKTAPISSGTQFIDDEGDRSIYLAIQTLNVGESPRLYTSKVRKISDADAEYTSKLLNGDFSNGTASWSSSTATLTNESGTLVATGTGASTNVSATQSVSVVVGNKYLVKARFKVDSSESLRVGIGSATALGSGFIQTLTPIADTWYEVHTIRTAVTASFAFTITQVFSSTALSTGKKLIVDYISLVDLTESFPNGIPSDEVLAEIFTNTPAPYKLGVKSLINDKLYKRYVQSNEVVLVTDDNRKVIDTIDLFKADSIAIGAVGGPDGTLTATTSYRTSGFLDVAAFSKIKLSGFTHTNLAYAFYDDNFAPIPNTYKTGTSSGFVLNGLIDVPAKAKYFCKTVKTLSTITEDYATISIKGLVTKDKLDAFAIESDTLAMSEADSTEVIRVDLMTDLTKSQGEFTESGVINNTSEYMHSGLLDVTDFNGVFLFGFAYYPLTRFWLDENQAVIQKFDGNVSLANYVISGFYKKPKGAKYFVANIAKPGFVEANTVKIYGERQLNTSDFQRKGSSGDATQGWETTTDAIKTQKDVEVYSDLYPEVKPVKIINYGKQIGYDYGANINFDTEIYRLGWGLQIAMNLTKPNAPDDVYSVKNVKGQNGLLAEWGVEGFSWHVCPPNMDWGERAWMMLKLGGTHVRSNTVLPIKNASMIQTFAPVWTERRDRAGLGAGFNGGWTELTADGAIDDTIPTRVMLRSSANFASPEYYRGGYSNMQGATWDRFFRCRGGYSAAQAAQHGDSIHKQVYSVATGADAQGNPVLKDVAQIEFLYNDDASPESAKIVFKVWNKVTESWEIKLTL